MTDDKSSHKGHNHSSPHLNRLGDLRDNTNINIMSETDHRNPYGPNFSQLPKEVKVYYKFLRMKAFVHVS